MARRPCGRWLFVVARARLFRRPSTNSSELACLLHTAIWKKKYMDFRRWWLVALVVVGRLSYHTPFAQKRLLSRVCHTASILSSLESQTLVFSCAAGTRSRQDALGLQEGGVYCRHRGQRGLRPLNSSAIITRRIKIIPRR